jgi:phage terminase large subunit GpA-like protein
MEVNKNMSLDNLFRNIARLVAPPKKVTMSQWADEFRQISREAASEPGQWSTDRTPYMREIMDAISNAKIKKVVIMSSAQVGKSEILLNAIGYYVDYDPSPIMLVQPTLELAKSFSKTRLAHMIRDTKVLTDKFDDAKSRDGDNTVLQKSFIGGYIKLVGANSEKSLSSAPIRILLADEIDRYPESVGEEGDPLSLAEKRTTTFWNRKKVFVSTPTNKGASKIEDEYNLSTMEKWNLPCPHCEEFQPLEWSRINFDDETMTCKHCGDRASELDWKGSQGKWIALHPERSDRGFHLNELASPWKSWGEIIKEFKQAKISLETYRVWVNTSLGETWEDHSEETSEDVLLKRREVYNCQVPDDVLVLTAGVDTQDDRLEVEVVGWGVGEESWGIKYTVFRGVPDKPAVWKQLDDLLNYEFSYKDGSKIRIATTCVDSGGHYTQEVYKYCKSRQNRRVWAIKGRGGAGIPFVGKATKNNREACHLFTLGVDAGKETVTSRLKIEYFEDGDTSGYCHFPMDDDTGYNQDFFKGLLSEKYKKTTTKQGKSKFEWVKVSSARNEPLDLRNYATAALKILNVNLEELKKQKVRGNLYGQRTVPKKRRTLSKGVR